MAADIKDVRTGRDQVRQRARSRRRRHARGLRHRGPRRALRPRTTTRGWSSASAARKPDGWTALYDAIGVYLNGAAAAGRPEDPGPLHRRRRHAQLDHASARCSTCCKASDVTVYADRLPGAPGQRPDAAADAARSAWRRLTGGQALFPRRARSSTAMLREDRAGARRALHASATSRPTPHRRRLARRRDQS